MLSMSMLSTHSMLSMHLSISCSIIDVCVCDVSVCMLHL